MQILITVITWPSRWRAAGDMVCLATPVLPRPFFAGVVASLSEHGGLSSDLTPKVMSDLVVVVGQKWLRMEIEHLGISWFQWENDNTPICTSGFRGSTFSDKPNWIMIHSQEWSPFGHNPKFVARVRCDHQVIKHGWLENPPFMADSASSKPPFIVYNRFFPLPCLIIGGYMKLHIDITMHRANLWNGTLYDPMKTVQHITTCRFQTVSLFGELWTHCYCFWTRASLFVPYKIRTLSDFADHATKEMGLAQCIDMYWQNNLNILTDRGQPCMWSQCSKAFHHMTSLYQNWSYSPILVINHTMYLFITNRPTVGRIW